MSDKFYQRLSACIDAGDLTAADLSYWFDRPYHTVWFWVKYKRTPRGSRLQLKRTGNRISLLEKAVRQKLLPAPIDLSQTDRPKYITKIRHDLETGAI